MIDQCLLVTDLDGTLLGDESALERFVQWRRQIGERLKLVYASGRFVDDIWKLIERIGLPAPEAVIGGVGTQIDFAESILDRPSWCQTDRESWSSRRIRAALDSLRDLRPQPDEFQSDHKVSFYVRGASDRLIERIHETLRANRITAELVYSSNRDLDILPRGIHKGSAARFLADLWSFSLRQVIVCGDSGNDRSMFQQRFLGIVVGNAQPELRRLKGTMTYFARRKFADGILQGLGYWLASEDFPAPEWVDAA